MTSLLNAPLSAAAIAGEANLALGSKIADAQLSNNMKPYISSAYKDEKGSIKLLYKVNFVIGERFVTEEVTRVSRYQTAEEIGNDGNAMIYFDSESDHVTVHRAQVLSLDGTVHVIDQSTIQVVDDNEDDVFSDTRIAVLPWPALEPGAITILEYSRKTDTKKLVMPWSRTLYPQTATYNERFELSANWKSNAAEPNWNSSDEVIPCVLESTNKLKCEASALPFFPSDDTVNYYDQMPQLTIAHKTDWSSIGEIVGQFVLDAMTSSKTVVEKARELTAGVNTEEEKLAAIYQFVSRDVRYVGLEHGNYSHIPRPSDVTLSRRFGDCKDKTSLLLDMLRSVEIYAYPVLVATRRDNPEKLSVPAAGYFNHLIACGTINSSQEFCLDPTDSYSAPTHLSSWIQGAVALKLDLAGPISPKKLGQDKHRWVLAEDMELNIRKNGTLSESSKLTYSGPYASFIRSSILGMDSKERTDWAIETYQNVVSDSAKPEFQFSGVDDQAHTLEVSANVDYEDMVSTDADLYYAEDAVWLDRMLGYFNSENEHFDYHFSGLKYRSTVVFDVDKKWRVERTGPALTFKSRFGSLTRVYSIEDKAVKIVTTVDLPQQRVLLEDIPKFNSFLKTMKKQNKLKIAGSLVSKK